MRNLVCGALVAVLFSVASLEALSDHVLSVCYDKTKASWASSKVADMVVGAVYYQLAFIDEKGVPHVCDAKTGQLSKSVGGTWIDVGNSPSADLECNDSCEWISWCTIKSEVYASNSLGQVAHLEGSQWKPIGAPSTEPLKIFSSCGRLHALGTKTGDLKKWKQTFWEPVVGGSAFKCTPSEINISAAVDSNFRFSSPCADKYGNVYALANGGEGGEYEWLVKYCVKNQKWIGFKETFFNISLGCLSICSDGTDVYAVTAGGYLLKFTGETFELVGNVEGYFYTADLRSYENNLYAICSGIRKSSSGKGEFHCHLVQFSTISPPAKKG
ncbi:hypothetical protein FACS189449_07190 [Alphaproteobacteria bacterium]|nr:hypothetical protein FACS189449_07190 [Alphaproteobacteria bacterium]